MNYNYGFRFVSLFHSFRHLPRSFSGLTVTVSLGCLTTALPAADLQFAAVLKGQEFAQTSADIVALGEWNTWYRTGEVQNEDEHEEPPFVFEALGIESQSGALLSGTLATPGGEVLSLGRGEDQESPEVGLESGASSPAALDAAWPAGDYTLAFTGEVDGALTPVTLSLGGSVYPPVPHITNFSALQSVDAAAGTVVQWAPMDGDADDFILLNIFAVDGENEGETIYETGLPGDSRALDGTATQTTIPAGMLSAGSDYQGEVLFFKTVDATTTQPLYVAGYYKLTGFLIRTAALPDEPLGSQFLRANPRDGWEWVSRDSAIAFHFSHPMAPELEHISIEWTKDGIPLSIGTFSYHWTQGNTVLLCEFSETLPGDSEIGWELNLSEFQDANGFPLSGTAAGRFRTDSNAPETPPDVEMVFILKTRAFTQADATPVPSGRYEAVVEVDANAANRLKSASVTSVAGGQAGPLYADPWDGDEYEAPGEYGSQADLDRFYPNGDYQFALNGLADGEQTMTLSLGSADQYPDGPTITNLTPLQAVDPAAAATVQWTALSGWSSEPSVGAAIAEFEIIDEFNNEVFYVELDQMTSGSECEIPAGTLRPGRVYQGELSFVRITDLDATSYPGAVGVAGFESVTQFTITTSGEPELPLLTLQHLGDIARFNFANLRSDTRYALDVSSDLQRWVPLQEIWSGVADFDDHDARYFDSRFYRLRESCFDEDLTPRISIQGKVWADSMQTTVAVGAVVGTSLDGQTTLTDEAGNFFLITDSPEQNSEASYTIQVSLGAQSRSFGPFHGDQPREQQFSLE